MKNKKTTSSKLSQLTLNIDNWLNEYSHFFIYSVLAFISIFYLNMFLELIFIVGSSYTILLFAFLVLCFGITLKAKEIERGREIRKESYSKMYLVGLIPTLLLFCYIFYIGSQEVSSKVYNSFDKKDIHSELSDNKITVFEAFIIINRDNEELEEIKRKGEKEEELRELEARKEAKEKLLN